MTKLLLCDVDGTLTETISGETFKKHSHDVKILPGVDKAIKHYAERGWTIVGISNQGGVAAGYKSLWDADMEMRYTIELLPQIKGIFFCTDFKGFECWYSSINDCVNISNKSEYKGKFRKPEPGMILQALDSFKGNLELSWMIGDRAEDEEAARSANIKYLDAIIWRERFTVGTHSHKVSLEQLSFLEM